MNGLRLELLQKVCTKKYLPVGLVEPVNIDLNQLGVPKAG